MTDAARLARWQATREGARYACPNCWHGQRDAGRCDHCRRFDVFPIRPRRTDVRHRGPITRPILPVLAQHLEDALARARKARRG